MRKKILIYTLSIFTLLLFSQSIFGAGIDLTLQDNRGFTVADTALERLGKNNEFKDKEKPEIPYLTKEDGLPNLVNIIKLLFEKGAEFNKKNESQNMLKAFVMADEGNLGKLKAWLDGEDATEFKQYNTLLTKLDLKPNEPSNWLGGAVEEVEIVVEEPELKNEVNKATNYFNDDFKIVLFNAINKFYDEKKELPTTLSGVNLESENLEDDIKNAITFKNLENLMSDLESQIKDTNEYKATTNYFNDDFKIVLFGAISKFYDKKNKLPTTLSGVNLESENLEDDIKNAITFKNLENLMSDLKS